MALFDVIQSVYFNGTSVAVSPTVVGNTVVVAAVGDAAQTPSASGISFTEITDLSTNTNLQGPFRRIWYGIVTSSFTSISISGGTHRDGVMWEIEGTLTYDKFASASGASSTANSGNTATLSKADEIVLGFIDANNTTPTAGATYTQDQGGVNNDFVRGMHKVVSATTAVSATSGNSLGQWDAACFTFYAATIEQEGFRARHDDGSETTATWRAPQDTHFTAPLGENVRLRFIIDTPDDPGPKAYQVAAKKSTDSAYLAVPTSAAPFPTIEATQENSTNTAGTSHAITLPTGIVDTDLVLIIMDIGSTSATLNALTDWDEVLDENAANGLKILRYTGSGVPSNPTFTSSASTRSASIAYRISGADKSIAPTIGTTATGTSTTPNPPSVSPPGGTTKSFLIIAFYGAAGEEADDDTWSDTPPTDYGPTPPLQKACGTAGTNLGGMIAAASRQLSTGSAVDPGTFAKDVSAAWRAQTILIHPAIPPIYIAASANIAAGGEDTTAQLTAPSGKSGSDFTTGRMWDNENGSDTIDLGSNDYTELEWCLQAQSPAANDDVYQFRVTVGGTALNTYSVTPEWTIGTGLVDYELACDGASVAVSGTAATLKSARSLTCAATAITVSGTDASLERHFSLPCDGTTITVSATAASLLTTRTLTCDSATIAITGTDLTPRVALPCASTTVSVIAQDATLTATRVLSCQGVSVAVNGTDATLLADRVLALESTPITVTGADAGLTYSNAGNPQLNAEAGAIAVSAQSATLTAARRLTCAPATCAITLTDATVTADRRLTCASSSVTINTQAATITAARHLACSSASVAVSVTNATVTTTRTLNCQTASLSVSAGAATIAAARHLTCVSAAVSLSPSAVSVSLTRRLVCATAVIAVTAADATLYNVLVQAVIVGAPAIAGPGITGADLGLPGASAAAIGLPQASSAQIGAPTTTGAVITAPRVDNASIITSRTTP